MCVCRILFNKRLIKIDYFKKDIDVLEKVQRRASARAGKKGFLEMFFRF